MSATPGQEQIKRWRLILGRHAQESLSQMGGGGGCQLSAEQTAMDEALAAIYDESEGEGQGQSRGGKYFHFEETTWRFCWKNSGKQTCLRKSCSTGGAQKKSCARAPLLQSP